jgi:hypothetical protein
MPVKDEVQEEVSKLKNLQIKTSIKKDTTLNFPMWYDNRTKEAFLMHVMVVLDMIKKCGHFKDYKNAQKAYVEQKEAVNSAKAWLALLDRTREGSGKLSKKLKKAKKAKAKSKEADGVTKVPEDPVKANFHANLEKAKKAAKDAKGAMTPAASKMFAFYLNLLSPKSKYVWNKIVVKQTESNLYVNLQGVSLEGPREMSRELFNHYVVSHLLTVFPINAAEQQKVLHHKCTQETPARQHMSVCTSSRATQCLHCSDAMLLLQPQRKYQHQTREHSVQGGWAGEPYAVNIPYPVARPVQHEQEDQKPSFRQS